MNHITKAIPPLMRWIPNTRPMNKTRCSGCGVEIREQPRGNRSYFDTGMCRTCYRASRHGRKRKTKRGR